MKKLLTTFLLLVLFAPGTFAYGPRGHQLVGAIADRRLAKNPTVAAKVRQILDGLTLEQAATLPDEIKSWDDCREPGSTAAVTTRKRINDELRAFVNANRCKHKPYHGEFHYTDVPVAGDETYASGQVGRSEFDVVHMIPFCIRVLSGAEPEHNERRITKAVAVILLTHYLGDIHQPLHVGAEFFDDNGQPFEPSADNPGFGDQGGNKLTLFTLNGGKSTPVGKFHSYWDSQTVANAFGSLSNTKVAQQLASREPDGWRLSGTVDTWAEKLADEIMPLSREAHSRLVYSKVVVVDGEHDISSGNAKELKKTNGQFYAVWAHDKVKSEIHKAGWRLAFILEQAI